MNHITAIQTLYSVGIGLLYHSVFRGKTGYKDKVDGKEATPKMKFKAYSLLLINLSFQIYILLMIPILFEGLSIYLTTALGTLILLVPLAC